MVFKDAYRKYKEEISAARRNNSLLLMIPDLEQYNSSS
jgi:hypothetical protein